MDMPDQGSNGGPLQEIRAAALGNALAALEAGRLAAAQAQAGSWAARDPHDVEAVVLFGLALAAQGQAARAAPLLQAAARSRPGFAHPCRDLARLRADAPALVAAQFRACRALAPHDTKLGYAYAEFLLDSGNAAAAAAVLRSLLAGAPRFGPAHNLFGMALIDLGEPQAAIAAFRSASELDPAEGATWANLGMALKIEGRFDEALAAYDRALTCAPSDRQIRLNRAIALLRAGRLAQAWPDYECRLDPAGGHGLPREQLLPSLDTVDLAGRTVLAWHEEGFGDTIQFARYLPLLAARGARVAALVPAELAHLFGSLDGVAEVLTGADALPAFDWHVPFFSLPRAFGTTLQTIPSTIPYLRADPARVAVWAARLPDDGLRVGVVWAGQARPWLAGFAGVDARRSTDLALLAPLGRVPGVALVSLQKGAPAAQAHPPPAGLALYDPMPGAADFADTAAIIANLDMVVSVDTAVVHLAGALGKPVLLLDRYDNCWRWLSGREDSPWYPTLRILRQPIPGDWASVVGRAAAMRTGRAARPTGRTSR